MGVLMSKRIKFTLIVYTKDYKTETHNIIMRKLANTIDSMKINLMIDKHIVDMTEVEYCEVYKAETKNLKCKLCSYWVNNKCKKNESGGE